MALTALIPLAEYLSSSYEPDCDYVEGKLVPRNAGERDHSYLQFLIAKLLDQRGLLPFAELRVQVTPDRFRVPDVLAERQMPQSRFLRHPPYIVVEILSPEDRAGETAAKIDDYLAFGVGNIWVVDPPRHRVSVQTRTGSRLCTGSVETSDGHFSIPLNDIYGHMPPSAQE